MQRYYFPSALQNPKLDVATLDGPEAHHLLNVMRGKVGDEVVLFDGAGWEYAAAIAGTAKKTVDLQITERREVNREPSRKLILGVGMPKGDRQRTLIEKCTELGVSAVIPLSTERSVAKVDAKAKERLERFVLEATKQCGRTLLMQIGESITLADFLAVKPAVDCGVFASLHGQNSLPRALANLSEGAPLYAAIGPEGGWTEAEEKLATGAGWVPVCLSQSVLRVETAAIAVAAISLAN